MDRKWILITSLIILVLAVFSYYSFFVTTPQEITSISWMRTGGFAGLDEAMTIEFDGSVSLSSNLQGEYEFILTEAELTELSSLIDKMGFMEFDDTYEARSDATDFFTYSLNVERGSKVKQVKWVDDWATENQLPEGLKDIEAHVLSIIHGVGHGGVEGTVSDELGRAAANLVVSIINGSVGYPEIAVITNDNGFYRIGSIPPGVFNIGVHNENGERIGEKTAFIRGGETVTLNITVSGYVKYENYGGLGLFEEGIYVVATDTDPLALYESEETTDLDNYWRLLKGNVTEKASTIDFISILISRGDFSSGGYIIQIKSQVWLESDPVVCFFTVNLTDPGEGVAVTEALTSPLALVPIGNLSAGKYVARAHIDRFILTYDPLGKPLFRPVMTLLEEVWETGFEVS